MGGTISVAKPDPMLNVQRFVERVLEQVEQVRFDDLTQTMEELHNITAPALSETVRLKHELSKVLHKVMDMVQRTITNHLQRVFESITRTDQSDLEMLRAYQEQWSKFQRAMPRLAGGLQQLDTLGKDLRRMSDFVYHRTSCVAKRAWKTLLQQNKNDARICSALSRLLIEMNSEHVALIGDIVQSFKQLDQELCYQQRQTTESSICEYFRAECLRTTSKFHGDLVAAKRRIAERERQRYMEFTLKLLADENSRFHGRSVQTLWSAVLIEPLMDVWLSEFKQHLNTANWALAAKVFNVCTHAHELPAELAELYGAHVQRKGHAAIAAALKRHAHSKARATAQACACMQKLIELREQCDDIIAIHLGDRAIFRNAIGKSYAHLLNDAGVGTNMAAMWVARYCDQLLKNKNNERSCESIEHLMSQLIYIIQCLEDKAVFRAYYGKLLGQRILQPRTCSCLEFSEAMMIGYLERSEGKSYCHKFRGMIDDMRQSRLLQSEFDAEADADADAPFEWNVRVLTTYFWTNIGLSKALILPDNFEQLTQQYDAFYRRRHCKSKLVWQHELSTIEMIYHACESTHELMVTTPQAVILLLFNDRDCCSVAELRQLTGLSLDCLKQELAQFCKAKLLAIEGGMAADQLVDHTQLKLLENFRSKKASLNFTRPRKLPERKEHAICKVGTRLQRPIDTRSMHMALVRFN